MKQDEAGEPFSQLAPTSSSLAVTQEVRWMRCGDDDSERRGERSETEFSDLERGRGRGKKRVRGCSPFAFGFDALSPVSLSLPPSLSERQFMSNWRDKGCLPLNGREWDGMEAAAETAAKKPYS